MPKPIANLADNQPAPSSTKNKDILTAAKGGGITFLGKIFEYFARFVFGIIIARVVGAEQFGLYNLAITVSLIASNMAMFGLQVGMVRFLPPAIREQDERSIWGIIGVCVGIPLFISISLAVSLFLAADPLADLLFHDPRMVPLLRIVSMLVPLDTLGSMAYVVTISFKQPKYSVIANNILTPLIKLLLAVGFLAVGFSTQGVLAAHIIATAAGLAILTNYLIALLPQRRVWSAAGKLSRQLLRYSIPVHLGWMVKTLNSTFSTLVLGFLGLATGVGIFTVASTLSMVGSMFFSSVGNISTPIIADLHSQGLFSQMKSYYQTTTRWMVLFNLPVFMTSIFFAKPLLGIFGDDFTSGEASMMILAFGTLAYTGTGIGSNILDMTDHQRINTVNSVLMVLVTIVLNVLLIPVWGVNGAAAAWSLSTILVNFVCLIEVWVFVGMQPYNLSFYKPIAAGLVAALPVFLVNHYIKLPLLIHLVIGGGSMWITYGLALYLLKLSADDRIVVDSLLSRIRAKHVQDVSSS